MEMINAIKLGDLRSRRHIIGVAVLWVVLGFSGTVSATTLQNMFDGGTFTQDGLEFNNFTPVLSNTFPSGQDLENLIKTNPQALFDISFLDFDSGKFSHSWGNAQDANAGNIGLEILPDNPATPAGVDPGFRLNSAAEWTVDAGYSTPDNPNDNIASAQLSAFAYTVTSNEENINSAEINQLSTIDAIGPDLLSFSPFEWPDVAAGFALQFIMDQNSNDILDAILNFTLHSGVQSTSGVINFSQFNDWSGFSGRDTIRVVNVVGVAASSEGGFTMNTLEQRIDPPFPGISQVPEPTTLALLGLGLAGIGFRRQRIKKAA